MNKNLTLFVAGLCLMLCSCACHHGSTNDPDKVPTCGGYSKFRAVTAEDVKLFNKVYKGEEKLTPIEVATQVVAGLNYDFRCTNESGVTYKVTIFAPLPNEGEPSLRYVGPLNGK